MNQQAYQEISKMINAFPQSAKNPTALLLTFEEDLTGISDQAIAETAKRFRRNEIPEQSKTFAPSIAEFVTAARRQEDLMALRDRPRLPPPPVRPGPPTPPLQLRTQAERQRQERRMADFHCRIDSAKEASAKAEAAEQAAIRERYGMTPEALAVVPDAVGYFSTAKPPRFA